MQAQAPEPTIVVHAAGDEPRAPLRWIIPPAGTTRTTALSLGYTLSGSALGANPVSIEMVMTTENTVVGPGADDSTTVASRITDARVVDDAAATDALRTGGLVGWSWESDITAEGRVVETRAQVPTGLDPTVAATMNELLPQLQGITKPFPTEPIGLAARWRVTEYAETNGVPITNHTDYRLVRRSGDEVELLMTIRQKANRGPADFPGLAAGVKVEITSWRGVGKGRQTLDLSQPFDPVASKTSLGARQRFRIRQGKQSQNVGLNSFVTFSVV